MKSMGCGRIKHVIILADFTTSLKLKAQPLGPKGEQFQDLEVPKAWLCRDTPSYLFCPVWRKFEVILRNNRPLRVRQRKQVFGYVSRFVSDFRCGDVRNVSSWPYLEITMLSDSS